MRYCFRAGSSPCRFAGRREMFSFVGETMRSVHRRGSAHAGNRSGRYRFRRFGERVKSDYDHEMSGGYVIAAHGNRSIEIFESFEFNFYARLLLANLFEQHLAEVFRHFARLSSTGHAIKSDGDAFFFFDCPFQGRDLDIWRYTMRHLLEQGSPVETPINESVERFGCANNAVQFLGTLLRGGDLWLDLGPFTLHRVEATLALQNPIAGPEIVQDQQYREANAGVNAQLERIALSLSLLENFFVEKI